MKADRKTAVIAGILFIVATAASLLGTSFTQSILDAPEYLTSIAANQGRVVVGVLFEFIAAGTSASIAISLYPVLRRYRQGLALGSVGFRLIEAVFYLVATLALLALLSLSQQYAGAGAPAASEYSVLGSLLLAVRKWANFVPAVMAFCVGALLYYWVFFQSRLIPRWLSGWGLIGAALLLSMTLLILFGAEPAGTTLLLAIPIALQEIVLAIWLIAKGFDPSAITAGSAAADAK